MIVTRPLDELIERAARGQAGRRSTTTATASAASGASCSASAPVRRRPYLSSGLVRRRPRARHRGARADGPPPGPGRLRPDLLAPKRARLPVPLRRPGRPQRDPRLRAGGRASASWRSSTASPRRRRSGACGSPTSAPCAVATATGRSRTCCTTSSASRGWCGCASSAYSRLLTRALLGPGRRAPPAARAACRCGCAPGPLAGAARLAVDTADRRSRATCTGGSADAPRGRTGWADARWAGARGPGTAVSRPLRVLIGAFGATGHVFPALALARELRARGHEVAGRVAGALARGGRGARASLRSPRPSTSPSRSRGRGCRPSRRSPQVVRELRPALRELRPRRRRQRLLHPAADARRRDARDPAGDAGPARLPRRPTRACRASCSACRPPRTPLGSLALAAGAAVDRQAADRASATELNEVRAELGLPPLERFYGGLSDQLALVATFPQLEYPRDWPAHVHVTGPMFFELPHPPSSCPRATRPLVLVAGSTAQDQELEFVRVGARGARRRAGPGARGDEPARPRAGRRRCPANATVVDWVSYAAGDAARVAGALQRRARHRGPGARRRRPGARLARPTATWRENGARVVVVGRRA